MSAALGLALVGVAVWAIALLVGGLWHRRAGLLGAGFLSTLGGVAVLAAGIWAVAGSGTGEVVVSQGLAGSFTLRLTPLAGVFIAALGLVAAAVGAYLPRYHSPGAGSAYYLVVYQGALISSLLLLAAGSVTTFLVAWETMTITSYLMVIRRHRERAVARGGFLFLALGEIGFALVVAALALLAAHAHSLDFTAITAAAPRLPSGLADAVFLLALLGFGFKAGMVPLHLWLPEAHPVAPADGSGFLSGVVTKLGIYGICLVVFEFLPRGPAWWGLLILGLGALSAVLGVLYALMERDWKRFLAFSTIENIGVVLIALGASLTFFESSQPALGALLLIAALYHVANHATYKTLLFLNVGVVEHAAGSRDLDRLGGLARRLPRTAVLALVATMGIAALPPLNGFVSEWLVFQGLFQGFRIHSHLIGVLLVVAAAVLALTGGLAVNAFARGFGIPFLGMPRTEGAGRAEEDHQPVVGPALLAVACVFLALGAPLVLTGLDRVASATTGVTILARLVVPGLTVIPAHTNFSSFSPTWLAVCLLGMILVPVLLARVGRRLGADRRAPVWDGGILRFRPRMQYTATTHANPVRVTFDGLYRPQIEVRRASDDPAGQSGPVHYGFKVTPIFERYLYRPVARAVEAAGRLVRPLESGNLNAYLLYIFVAIIIVYAVAVR